MQPAEHHWRCQSELALRLGMLAGKPEFGSIELIENMAARFQIAPARLGERKAACGAREQPSAKLFFQGRQLPADRCERLQAAACRRQAASVGDSGEHAHGSEAVHFDYSEIREYQLE
jgi:hypothetical protein